MKALVVEDEPAIARILSRKLKGLGYECTVTDSVKEAKGLLTSIKPSLLFLDYVLTDGRSKELAVEGYLKEVPQIYLMSAFMEDLEKKDFDGLNVEFLKKPFQDLNSILNQLGSKLSKN
jgi:DNA-binding response OmpR family regulator